MRTFKTPRSWLGLWFGATPFLNWFTEIANERDDLQYWDKQNMGDPDREDDRERLRNASPIFFIDKIKVSSSVDSWSELSEGPPMEEAIRVSEQLAKRGVSAEFYYYSDEGHGFRAF